MILTLASVGARMRGAGRGAVPLRLLALLAMLGLVLVWQVSLGQADQESRPIAGRSLRVLFIGHSYLYFNNLPVLVQGLAESAGYGLEVETVWGPGETLQGHWRDRRAVQAIREGNWDYVVLAEQSTLGPYVLDGEARVNPDPSRFHYFARLFDAEIRAAGAHTLLFLSWARRYAPGDQDLLNSHFLSIARELGAHVAAVGPAWLAVRQSSPSLRLYRRDQSHPMPAGSYLAACSLFVTLFQQSPVGLAHRIEGAAVGFDGSVHGDGASIKLVDLEPARARLLQTAAWESSQGISSAGEGISAVFSTGLQP